MPDFFAEERFLLLPDFLPDERLLADFFAVERFLPLADFLPAALFLPADFLPDERFLLLPDFLAAELLRAPDFLPPLSCLFTVRQARSSASFFDTPFFS